MKKLRLLITKYCPKRCDGCCNKQWDLNNLPIVQHFNYDKIILTGGEPLSDQTIEKTICLLKYLNNIDINPQRKIYLYTADYDNLYNYLFILKLLNGITITLHNKKDGKVFFETQNTIKPISE
jgi:MoaA/NifB/PqqE/SkfB family radical SAM enzyme